jgi:hypothetical protein
MEETRHVFVLALVEVFLYAKIHSGDSYLMLSLDWIAKEVVVDHHNQASFRILKSNNKLSDIPQPLMSYRQIK